MDDLFTQLKKGQNVTLTSVERAEMRKNLLRTMRHAPVPSPYQSKFVWTSFARALVFVLVGMIVGGTSLSFASQTTLPGDALYPIKTGIAEKVGGVLAFSTESKARYSSSLVSKRIGEINQLKASGAINNPDIEQATTASFNATFSQYQTDLSTLRDQGRVARVAEIAQATLAELRPQVPETDTQVAVATMAAVPAAATTTTPVAVSGMETTADTSVGANPTAIMKTTVMVPATSAAPAIQPAMMKSAAPVTMQAVLKTAVPLSALDASLSQAYATLETTVQTGDTPSDSSTISAPDASKTDTSLLQSVKGTSTESKGTLINTVHKDTSVPSTLSSLHQTEIDASVKDTSAQN